MYTIGQVSEMFGLPISTLRYYDTAIADGNEEKINAMLPDHLPEDIQKLYNNAHK